MEDKYYEFRQVLDKTLTPLGFEVQPEISAGPGRATSFKMGDVEIQILYNQGDRAVTLRRFDSGKTTDSIATTSADSVTGKFMPKLEAWANPAFDPAAPQTTPVKKKGFMAALFGKK